MHFSDLSESYIALKLSFNKVAADKTIANDEPVSLCNFIFANLWKDLRIEIGGKPINSQYGNFLYESYFKLLLDTSYDGVEKWEVR